MPVPVTIYKDNQVFTFEQFGLALLKHNIPPLPEKEDFTIQIPGRHGKVRMGAQYKERPFTLECILMADDPMVDYQMRLAQVAELLDTISEPAYWVFGDMPGKRWLAEYTGLMTVEKLIFDGNITLPMVAYQPFPESVTDVSNGWQYGQGYTYGMGLRYGDKYSFQITQSGQQFVIYHAGNVPLPPRIRITGTFSNLKLNDGRGKTLAINRTTGVSDVVEIDSENQQIYLNGTTNIFAQTNQVFFTLPHGETTFTVTADSVNCTIAFTPFRHRYLY